MTNKRMTKRTLIASVLVVALCFTMLLGTTFAWFTDSVTSASNVIQAGTLKVDIVDANDVSLAGEVIEFKTADNRDQSEILWEPGCTYEMEDFYIVNKGTLALKYVFEINGVNGNDKLLEALEWTVTVGGTEVDLDTFVGNLYSATDAGMANKSEKIVITAHMKEDAGNEYQGLSINGIGITVYATQLAYENDSFGPDYDADADYATYVTTFDELVAAIANDGYVKLANDITAPNNKRLDVPTGTKAVLDLNGFTYTSKDGGGSNTMAIYVNRGAEFVLEDSVGTGKIVSSCYGVYVQPNAKFIMNGGTISVSGNSSYDIGVNVWNAAFVMNAGTLESKYAVWTSNYWRDNGETDAATCAVTIADGCVINSTVYDLDYFDALDTILNIPSDLTTYPSN